VSRGSIAALVAGILFFASGARADGSRCAPGFPWVRLSLEGASFREPLRASVRREIASDLERRGLGVCDGAAAERPVAELRITLAEGEPLANGARPDVTAAAPSLSVSFELRDEASGERISRELSLAGVPSDALELSIAVAAEELLHAKWTQDSVARSPSVVAAHSAASTPLSAPPNPATPDRRVRDAAPLSESRPEPPGSGGARTGEESPSPESDPRTTDVGLLAASDTATAGAATFGADFGVAWGGRATIGARAGFRLAPPIASPHGAIVVREGLLRITGAVALVPRRSKWGGEIIVHGDLLYVALEGVASSSARALSGSASGIVLGGGLGGWVKIARSWSLVGEVTGGAPLYAVTASDSGTVVTGILRGGVIGLAFGVAMRL
jgi:hypothetical protein